MLDTANIANLGFSWVRVPPTSLLVRKQMKRYHNSKEENKRKSRSASYRKFFGDTKYSIEGRCHSKSPFDCGQPKCKICSKQRIDGKRDRIESKNIVKRDIKEWG